MKLTFEKKKNGDRYDYSTPYNSPEKYGMEHVGTIQWGEEDYSFNLTCVLRRLSDGTLWYAHDSGCSCPEPFEDIFEWERLFNLDPLAPPEERYLQPDLQEYRTFLRAVTDAFNRLKAA
jgi:hypothetical protein